MSDRGQRLLTGATRFSARALFRVPTDLPLPWPIKRRWTELAATANRIPGGLRRGEVELAGVPVERLEPDGGGTGAILYLHGGGYVQGSARVQRVAAARLAIGAGAVSYAPDYRLAPEHPFPAAFEDCLAVLRDLERREDAIVVAGDSAGAGLALAVALAAKEEGIALAGVFLICPWLDLTVDRSSGPDTDPILSRRFLTSGQRGYLAGRDAADPRSSPLLGDLAGLPPILVHTADEDPLRPDSEALAERASSAGVDVELERFGLWHDFHMHAGTLDVADRALERGAAFARARLSSSG